MAITKKMLEDLGLTSEQVNSIFAERGKEITDEKAKLEKLESDLAERDKSILDLSEKTKALDGTEATLKELQDKVAGYEKESNDRIEAEKQAKAESEFKTRFNALVGEQKWKHPDIETGRYNAFKQALADESNKGKGDTDIFSEITKDMDCYVNPQQATINLPGGSGITPKDLAQAKTFEEYKAIRKGQN